jgi:hypothetical protein
MTHDLDTTADALRVALHQAADQMQIEPGRWAEAPARAAPRRRAPIAIGVAACVALLAVVTAAALVLTRDGDKAGIGATDARGVEVTPDALPSDRADLEVFMRVDATQAEIDDVHEIVAALPGIARFAFLDKEDSLVEFRRIYAVADPDLTRNITADALPTSFRIDVRPRHVGDEIESRLSTQPGVNDIAVKDPALNQRYEEPTGQLTSSVEIVALPTLRYDAERYSVPAGIVEIVLRSAGGTHTLAIDDPRFEGFRLQSIGDPVSGTVELTPGVYTIGDMIPGHREAGEEATLVVTSPVQQLVRPVLASCTPTFAHEATGSGLAGKPGEVFAVPGQGASGPLALLLRYPEADAGFLSTAPNVTVDGRPGDYATGEGGQSSLSWLLPSGGFAQLSAVDLSRDDALALARAINGGGIDLPAGLSAVGTTTRSTWTYAECDDAQGGLVQGIEVIHGSRASRYAQLVAQGIGLRWDSGDASILVTGSPDAIPSSPPEIREASPKEWRRLLAAGRQPPG